VRLQQAPGLYKSHWPPGGVHAGGVGVGAAVLVLEEIGVMMEVTKVLELLDVRSEEVDEVLDDEEVSLLIVVLLGVVELLEGV
jgi:hypothetical protein